MSEILSAELAIQRLKENEQRLDVFVNEEGSYTTNTTPSTVVETLPSFMQRKETELNAFGAVGNGETLVSDEATLLAANASGSVTSVVLLASFTMTQDITLTKPFRAKPGAIITTTGYTLTINGPFSAGDYQVFTGSGTVSGLKEARPEWFGAKGDGVTDCSSAIQKVNDSTSGTIIFQPGNYLLNSKVSGITNNIRGSGYDTVFVLNNSSSPNNHLFDIESSGGTTYNITNSTLTQGQKTVDVTDSTGLSAGDNVQILYGSDPYDANEELLRVWMQIESVVGNVITFKSGFPEASASPGTRHLIYKFDKIAQNIIISDFAVDYKDGTVPDTFISVNKARNVTVERITFIRQPGIAIQLTEGENYHVNDILVKQQNLGHDASRTITAWGVTNGLVENIIVRNSSISFCLNESQNRGLTYRNIYFDSTQSASSIALSTVGGSKGVEFDNITINTVNSIGLAYDGQNAEVTYKKLQLLGPFKSAALADVDEITYLGIRYPRRLIRTVTTRHKIDRNKTDFAMPLPSGIVKSLSVYCNTTTGITQFYVLNNNNQGANVVSSLVANTNVKLTTPFTSIGNDYPFNNPAYPNKSIHYYSDGTVPADAYVIVTMQLFETATPTYMLGDNTPGILVPTRRVMYGAALPTSGTWTRGDRLVNDTPTVGQPKSWVCTVSGTPGTWVSEGNL